MSILHIFKHFSEFDKLPTSATSACWQPPPEVNARIEGRRGRVRELRTAILQSVLGGWPVTLRVYKLCTCFADMQLLIKECGNTYTSAPVFCACFSTFEKSGKTWKKQIYWLNFISHEWASLKSVIGIIKWVYLHKVHISMCWVSAQFELGLL